jgi:hypothetical protein
VFKLHRQWQPWRLLQTCFEQDPVLLGVGFGAQG